MSSETDSEADRRAYGQYASLAAEGDSDIDEEAATYLRSVRKEARAIPDVMISAQDSRPAEANLIPECTGHEMGEEASTHIQAGPTWIKRFMQDFLELRLALQRLELEDIQGVDEMEELSMQTSSHDGGQSLDLPSPPKQECAQQMLGLSALLHLDRMEAASKLEEEVERVCRDNHVGAQEVYSIYSLSAVLDYPLMASTEGSMSQLLRHCSHARRGCDDNVSHGFLDILEALAGAYFGQDPALRQEFREYGLHT